VVVANPLFSLEKRGTNHADPNPYRRFWRGIPPKSKGDYAFIIHMVGIAKRQSGRMAVIVPHGVLFRGGAERQPPAAHYGYTLNIPRYMDTFEPEEDIDLAAVQQDILHIEAELAEVWAKVTSYLKELVGIHG